MSAFPLSSAHPENDAHNVLAYISYIYSFLHLLTNQTLEVKQAKLNKKNTTSFSEFESCVVQSINRTTKLGVLVYSFSQVEAEKLLHITNEKNKKTKTFTIDTLLKAKEDLKELISQQTQKKEINLHFLNTLLARLQLSLPKDYEEDVWQLSLLHNKKLFIKNFVFALKGEAKDFFSEFQSSKNMYFLTQKSEPEYYIYKVDISSVENNEAIQEQVEQYNDWSGSYAPQLKMRFLQSNGWRLIFDKDKTLEKNPHLAHNKFLLFNSYLAVFAQKYWVGSLQKFLPVFIKINPLALEEDKKKDFYKKALQFYAYKSNLGLPILKNVAPEKYIEKEIEGVLELFNFDTLLGYLHIESKERLELKNYEFVQENYIPSHSRKENSLSILTKEKIYTLNGERYVALSLLLEQKPAHKAPLMLKDVLETTQEMKRLQAKAKNPLRNLKTKTFQIKLK